MFTIFFCAIWLTRCAFEHVVRNAMHFHNNYISKTNKLIEDTSSVHTVGNEETNDRNHLNSSDVMGNNNVDTVIVSEVTDEVDINKFRDMKYGVSAMSTARVVVDKNAYCYNMDHENRGKCVIFNHEKFDMDIDRRTGTDIDARRIHKVFSNLGFEVSTCDDFTFTEINDTIQNLSNENHSNSDCICIFVLTHGSSHDVLYAKDVLYKSDYIWKRFTADACASLAGKPKLFFFQACRGEDRQEPVELRNNPEMTVTDSVASYKIPTHADFLIAHSTVQGFYSFRNGEKGSCYIQYLCDAIEKYASTRDLISILTITARRVATDFNSNNSRNLAIHNKKQMPSLTSMLIRDLHFTPKQRNTNQITKRIVNNTNLLGQNEENEFNLLSG